MNKKIKTSNQGCLTPRDMELIERIIYNNGDDIAVSISRSFQRLEERLETIESRICSRLGEFEDSLDVIKDK